MILRYNIHVLDVDEAIEQLRQLDQAVLARGSKFDNEIQVSINMGDLDRLCKFIDWVRANEYCLDAEFESSTSLDRVYSILS